MTRIGPIDPDGAPEASRALAAEHEAAGARMTNMKWTAARSPESLAMLLTWYPLFDRIAGFLGERRAQLLAHAISDRNECLICSTYFRRILIDAGEDPAELRLDEGGRPGFAARPGGSRRSRSHRSGAPHAPPRPRRRRP